MLIDYSPFDFRKTCQEVFDILLREAEERGVQIVVNVDENIPKIIVGDKVRLQQIITNLLSNALKFSFADRAVVVQASLEDTNTSHESQIHLSITDTGIGIAKDKLDKIFDSFIQVDSTTTRKYGGTGLGLTIVKKLVELLNGKIWVESIQGIGSTFHVVLPMLVNITKDLSIDNQTNLVKSYDLTGINILLAEDNDVNRKSLVRILEKLGCIVDAVCDGNELVEAAKLKRYDVLIVDIQMPNMGGEEASRIIKSSNCINTSTPIVALTANIVNHERDRYLSAGMKSVLDKPIDFDRLFAEIYSAKSL
jgi:CheY-like chemotaxis protein/two-component sensor histidine kinase